MTPSDRYPRHRIGLSLLMAAVLAAASACAGDGDTIDAGDPTTTTTPTSTTSAVTDSDGDTDAEIDDDVDSDVQPEAGDDDDQMDVEGQVRVFDSGRPATDFEFAVVPALGGVSVATDDEWRLVSDGDYVGWNTTQGSEKPWRTSAFLTVAAGLTPGQNLATVDEWLEIASDVSGVVVEPTGDVTELFGVELTGYSFERQLDRSPTPLFTVSRPGYGGVAGAWWPYPHGVVYVGETGRGVLALGATGADEAELADGLAVLDDVVPHLELLGELGGPPANTDTLPGGDGAPSVVPAEPTGAAPVLPGRFQAVVPGTYEIVNFGAPFTVEIDGDWWVQPNEPGWTVLTAPDSFGPSNDGVSMYGGLSVARFALPGPTAFGEVFDLTDIRAFVAEPPSPLLIEDVADVDVGGKPALRFDLSFAEDVTCDESAPCLLTVGSGSGLLFEVRSGFTYRMYWIDDVPSGPMTIAISSTARPFDTDEFVERAEAMVAGIEFATD